MADSRLLALLEEDDDLLLLLAVKDGGDQKEMSDVQFDIKALSNDECVDLFRFDKDDLEQLRVELRIPERIVCVNRTTCPGLDALCIVLRRLAYPNRLVDLSKLFGRSEAAVSIIVKHLIDFLIEEHGHLLSSLNRTWLTRDNLDRYAAAVRERGGVVPNCWGFIDGTVRPLSRPKRHQRVVFNGHKRVHALKFQSVVAPNGLVANMFGPIEGVRHDAGLLRESGLLGGLRQHMTSPTGVSYPVYGDPAYPLSPYIITPYRGAAVNANENRFNKRMSAVRICVEWTFGKIIALFAFLDYKKNLKLHLQPVGKYYLVATLLTNCHTCFYGSQTSQFFNIEPPTVHEYITG